MSTIGIFGTGRMGKRLARLFALTGHQVRLGSRRLERAQEVVAGLATPGIEAATYEQAARAEVNLPAAGTARSAHVEVRDANNLLVRTVDLPLGSAASTWRWDGRDGQNRQRPDGLYRVTVGGRAADGAAAPLAFSVTGEVTGALRESGAVMLRLGGLTVGYDRLRDLGQAN